MREKEAQNDQYQNEKEELEATHTRQQRNRSMCLG